MDRPWIQWDDEILPPAFYEIDLVEVKYRDGRQAQGYEPWMFSGWNHKNLGTDIVAYRIIN